MFKLKKHFFFLIACAAALLPLTSYAEYLFTFTPKTFPKATILTSVNGRYYSSLNHVSAAAPSSKPTYVTETIVADDTVNMGFIWSDGLVEKAFAIDVINTNSTHPEILSRENYDKNVKKIPLVMNNIFSQIPANNGSMKIQNCHFIELNKVRAYQCIATGTNNFHSKQDRYFAVATSMLVKRKTWEILNVYGEQVMNDKSKSFDFKRYNKFINSIELK